MNIFEEPAFIRPSSGTKRPLTATVTTNVPVCRPQPGNDEKKRLSNKTPKPSEVDDLFLFEASIQENNVGNNDNFDGVWSFKVSIF